MKRVLKWLSATLGAVTVVAAMAAVYVYAASEYEIKRQYDIPLAEFWPTSAGAEAVARGKRLATIAGCYASCHGKRMEGSVLFDEPGIARINAPNLTRILPEYSDAELVRLLRHGVKRDGQTVWVMPSNMFTHLSDEDLSDIIAFVRSEPEQEGPMREVAIHPLGRVGILLGKFNPVVKQIDHAKVQAVHTDRSDSLKYGEYLVKTACTECHGQNLEGSEFVHAPNLLVAQAYSDEDFTRLMRTGKGLGNRELGLMSEVGAGRFPAFTDSEVASIRAYLKAFATQATVASAAADTKPPQGS